MLQQSGPVNTPCSGWHLKILWSAFRRLEIAETIRSSSAPTIGALISLQRNLAPGTEFLRPETKRLNRPFSLPRDRLAHIKRHTTPANAAFSREVSESAKFRECVVVCAARYEPVSTCNSLLSGKLTGNFTIFGSLEAISVRKTPVPQPLFGKFPTQINRENILKNREVLSGNGEFHLQGGKCPFLARLFPRGSDAICSRR